MLNNQKGVIAQGLILGILLIGIAGGVYLVQHTTNLLPKAFTPKDQIDVLTEQLLEADKKYEALVSKSPFIPQTASPSAKPIVTPKATSSAVQAATTSKEAQDQLNQMLGIVIRRKELLLQKIQSSPQEFLNKATLTDKADQLPEQIRLYVEKRLEVQGKLVVVHIDDFTNKKTSYDYFLQKGIDRTTENSYNLHFVEDPPPVLSGAEIKTKGIELDQHLVLQTGNATPGQPGLQILAAAPDPRPVNEQKTAVLLIKMADRPSVNPPSLDTVKNFLFNQSIPNSATTYYRETSYNKISFSGNTFGIYTIDLGRSCTSSDYWRIGSLAQKAFIKANGPLEGNFNRIIYVLPDGSCGFSGGLGTIGGAFLSESWIYSSQDVRVYLHELGHNLGVHHANKYICPVGTYTNCSEEEYGDIYDVMGNFWWVGNNILHFNAPHKIAVGWLSQDSVKTVTQSGIYSIVSLETPTGSATQVLKIKKPDTNEFYYISYRQALGSFQSGLPSELRNGASIHIWNGNPARQTKFITAIYSGPSDLALADGKTFYDKINKIQIKQISHTISKEQLQGSVSLGVEFNVSPSPTPKPTPRPASDQRVFVTSTTYIGNLGGLLEADNICQERANVVNLGGIWKAWLSDSNTSASSRLTHYDKPYKRLDGQTIANNWVDLTDGSLQNPIKVTEFGKERTDFISSVWTNTNTAGQIDSTSQSCSNWSIGSSSPSEGGGGGVGGGNVGGLGSSAVSSNWWTKAGYSSCNGRATLYCFEETASASASATIKPPIAAPSPTPIACTPCSADINKDGGVDIVDYSYLASCYNKKATDVNKNGKSCAPADIDGSGTVNAADNTCLQSQFGKQCSAVSSSKRVFVTSATYNGNLGGLFGADSQCQTRASAANLGGTWKAWLSDGVNTPVSKFGHSLSPYKLVSGNVIANNWAGLVSGTLVNSIATDETGKAVVANSGVWTNTGAYGNIAPYPYPNPSDYCQKWTSANNGSNSQSGIGLTGKTTTQWTDIGIPQTCDKPYHLYCFEQ